MKNYTKVIITTLISTALTACGGGGSASESVTPPTSTTPPPAKTVKVNGNLIDGYIVGATVFMDLNYNGLLDDGEPSDVTVEPTDSTPGWTLDVPEDCALYVPTVAYVPVGAIDLDTPDTPITEEYYLTIAPAFAQTTDEDMRNVTPLTTIIWDDIQRELSMDGKELTCQAVIANQELREVIVERLRQQELHVAGRYNVTVKALYSDYVADANVSLHGLAKALVPGLQKSYVETVELITARPDIDIGFIEYYFKDAASIASETWSRREYIQTSFGNLTDISRAMLGGLSSQGNIETARTMSTSTSNGLEVTVEFNFLGSGGICSKDETFTERNGSVGYGLTNVASANDLSWSGCQSIDAVSFNIAQRFNTKTYYDNGSTNTSSYHVYNGDNDARYLDLIGASAGDIGSGWLSSNLGHIALDFNDDYGYDADYWMRSRNEFFDSGDIAQKMYMHNSNDEYEVTTTNTDGTSSKQCGTWSGGVGSLVNCTE